MKKRLFCTILAIAVAAISVTACSSASEKQNAGTESDPANLQNMELLTGSAGGSWVTIGAGLADKFNEFYDGFPLTTIPGPGSLGNPPVIAEGDGQFGMSYGPFLKAAVEGTGAYDEPFTNLRAIAALQPTVVHVVADLEANSLNEVLSQKIRAKIGLPPVGNASTFIANSIFAASGMESAEDIKSYGGDLYVGDTESLNDAWKNRQIDMYFNVVNVPASAISEALISRKGEILPIEGDIAKMLVEKEGFDYYTIKANSYSGQDEDIKTVGLPIVLFTTADMDEDVVYNMTKALYENKEYFKGVHSSFEEFDPSKMASGAAIELHPGAIKFYEEVGLLK